MPSGVVYDATLVPCASTLCVVNIGLTEARVEALMGGFVRLREEHGLGDSSLVRMHRCIARLGKQNACVP
jgi:hypothetical protein